MCELAVLSFDESINSSTSYVQDPNTPMFISVVFSNLRPLVLNYLP